MNEQGRNLADASGADDEESFSLRPYIDAIWRYRFIIGGATVAMSVVFIVGVLWVAATYPSERVAQLQFRLLFDGAAQHRYPNGAPFSPTEIVGAPIVTEVFKANDLQQYGTYEAFKDALFIQQSNPKLDLLTYEYQAKLADTKLGPVDRARIEAEFNQKREILTDPSFSLSLRRSERFRVLPSDLAEKVLNDTLATWAVQAERMGAMKYQVPILSSIVLSKQVLDSEDYLVAADLLRAKAVRIINTLAELEKVPGALTIRTSKDRVSLPEIRANIEDALRFDLEPLLGVIRSEGVTKNARLLTLYATNQVFQLRLEKQMSEGRARAVQVSLGEYMAQRVARSGADARPAGAGGARPQGFETPALIPQFGESFLDRLVEMSAQTQTSDVQYRQKLTDMVIKENTQVAVLDKELAYYEDLVKSVQGVGSRTGGSSELISLIKARSQTAFATISKGADQLVDIYRELSAQNLNPVARLFNITGPFAQHTQSSLSSRSAGLAFLLVMTLTLVVATAGSLVHNAMKKGATR